MGNSELHDIVYLQWNELNDPKFNDKIRKHLYHIVESGELVYFNNAQSICLKKNLYDLSNILFFVEKYWKKLLCSKFPSVPVGNYTVSLLLKTIIKGSQKRKKFYGRLTLPHLATRCDTLAQIYWLAYKTFTRMKKALQSFKADINLICQLLLGKKSHMAYQYPSIFDSSNARRLSVPSYFGSMSGAFAITNNELYVPIEASVQNVK